MSTLKFLACVPACALLTWALLKFSGNSGTRSFRHDAGGNVSKDVGGDELKDSKEKIHSQILPTPYYGQHVGLTYADLNGDGAVDLLFAAGRHWVDQSYALINLGSLSDIDSSANPHIQFSDPIPIGPPGAYYQIDVLPVTRDENEIVWNILLVGGTCHLEEPNQFGSCAKGDNTPAVVVEFVMPSSARQSQQARGPSCSMHNPNSPCQYRSREIWKDQNPKGDRNGGFAFFGPPDSKTPSIVLVGQGGIQVFDSVSSTRSAVATPVTQTTFSSWIFSEEPSYELTPANKTDPRSDYARYAGFTTGRLSGLTSLPIIDGKADLIEAKPLSNLADTLASGVIAAGRRSDYDMPSPNNQNKIIYHDGESFRSLSCLCQNRSHDDIHDNRLNNSKDNDQSHRQDSAHKDFEQASLSSPQPINSRTNSTNVGEAENPFLSAQHSECPSELVNGHLHGTYKFNYANLLPLFGNEPYPGNTSYSIQTTNYAIDDINGDGYQDLLEATFLYSDQIVKGYGLPQRIHFLGVDSSPINANDAAASATLTSTVSTIKLLHTETVVDYPHGGRSVTTGKLFMDSILPDVVFASADGIVTLFANLGLNDKGQFMGLQERARLTIVNDSDGNDNSSCQIRDVKIVPLVWNPPHRCLRGIVCAVACPFQMKHRILGQNHIFLVGDGTCDGWKGAIAYEGDKSVF